LCYDLHLQGRAQPKSCEVGSSEPARLHVVSRTKPNVRGSYSLLVDHGLALQDPPLAMALLQDVFVVARPPDDRGSGVLHVAWVSACHFLFGLRINAEKVFVVRGSGRALEVDVAVQG